VIEVGKPLVEFFSEESPDEIEPEVPEIPIEMKHEDAGTVVGSVESGRGEIHENAVPITRSNSGFKVMPSIRALARRLDIDLTMVSPTGPDGLITKTDVERVATILANVGPQEKLRGIRRAMAQTMANSNSIVSAATIMDDVDIHAWKTGENCTMRLIRAMVMACQEEPALNAWFDSYSIGRRLLEHVDIGIAVDSEHGLLVPVLRDCEKRSREELRRGLDELKEAVKSRKIPPSEMRGNTITLSNFGTIAGRYAVPVIVPPTVAILGAGVIRDQVVAFEGQPAIHAVLPLSLSFDHRAVTGGEAGRFLAVIISDLGHSE
jgi:pyruvate dehydrogenase E2 component (dihydrolipoamide acetyltransferase)